jgi:Holliday junction resolvase-like predicted endonuclease
MTATITKTNKAKAFDMAKMLIKNKGYKIIAENHSGIDLIVKDEGDLVFVEVLVCGKEGFSTEPATTKHRQKWECMALEYLCKRDLSSCVVRFDRVEIQLLDGGKAFARYNTDFFSVG